VIESGRGILASRPSPSSDGGSEIVANGSRDVERLTPTHGVRKTAFGEIYQPTLVDRFGVWLSGRQIRRHVPDWQGKRIADIGCGFHAAFTRTVLEQVSRATLVDVSISSDLRRHPKVEVLEGTVPAVLEGLPSASLDVILCISVLEHLWNPLEAVLQFRRLLAPGGLCLINVPSWRGKKYLEYSAFRLGFSPAEEMDDHKYYFDVRDLWPILVRAGFRPSSIQCFAHKFGLNTFAVCGAGK